MAHNLAPFANHLWQSTVCGGLATLLALALRKQHARTRYWIWLAASLKFAVPLAALVWIGSQAQWRTAPMSAGLPAFVEELGQPFAPAAAIPEMQKASVDWMPALLAAAWLCGFVGVILNWARRWRRVRTIVRASTPLPLAAPVEVRSSQALFEPGVFGIWRPVLILPAGIADRLTAAQLDAVIAHELCHIRRRDNLFAAIHMAIQAIFWFHPLVWWIGARLVDERENACDEEVLLAGSEPVVYAESILKVCQFYVESPLVCAAGVTGADLKQRIARIMTARLSRNLDASRKLLLAAAAALAIAGPVAIGIVNAPAMRGQVQEPAATFEVASIKPSAPGQRGWALPPPVNGRLTTRNTPLKSLIEEAYHVQSFQVSGGPAWVNTEGYDLTAQAAGRPGMRQMRPMLQALLADRFKLVVRHESKVLPVYSIAIGKNGPKMTKSSDEDCPVTTTTEHPCGGFRVSQRRFVHGERVTVEEFADVLAVLLGRTVLDKTGLQGRYDIKLEWTPDEGQPMPAAEGDGANRPESSGGSIFSAIQEQLGLKLESGKGPVPMLVVDRAERPTGN